MLLERNFLERSKYNIPYIHNKPEFPEWVHKQKAKETEIREQHDSFYLYKITSVLGRKKERARRIKERCL